MLASIAQHGSPEQEALLAMLRTEGLQEPEIDFWCSHDLSVQAVLGHDTITNSSRRHGRGVPLRAPWSGSEKGGYPFSNPSRRQSLDAYWAPARDAPTIDERL